MSAELFVQVIGVAGARPSFGSSPNPLPVEGLEASGKTLQPFLDGSMVTHGPCHNS
jgi:hypothetical protein